MTWETLAMFTNLKSLDLDCWTYNYTHSIFTQTPKNLSFPRLREATFRGTHPKGAITSIVMGSPNLEAVHFLDMAGEVVEMSWDPDDIEQRHASSLKRFLERCVECQLLPKLHTLTLQCYPDWEKSTSNAHDTIVTWVPFLRYAGPRLRKLIIKLENYENDTGNDTRRCLLKDLGPLLQQADQLENLECFSISLQRCHCIEECRPPYDTNMRLLHKNFLGQEGASYAGLTVMVSS
ncbi:hypothetical protein FRC03_012711 [Tulasnella sp. 419]|nr:hypothetical protein FRC03_012711 [Tulasnella sp. 419]